VSPHPRNLGQLDGDARRRARRGTLLVIGLTIAVTCFAGAVALWMYWLTGFGPVMPSN
jgi:CHASE2 domain-containing sensor protein